MKRLISILVIILVTSAMLFSAVPVSAASSPPGANASAVGMSLSILDAGNNAVTTVHVGDVIKFEITLSIGTVASGKTAVNYMNGTLALRVADHAFQPIAGYGTTITPANPTIPTITSSTPFTVQSPFTYTVASADIGVGGNAGHIRVQADYGKTADNPSGSFGIYLFDPTQQTASATTSGEVFVLTPSIAVTKTASPTLSKAGDVVVYTIEVSNTGNENLTRVSVIDNDTQIGNISSSFPATLHVGETSGPVTFNRTILSTDPDPLSDKVTAIYQNSIATAITAFATASVDLVHPGVSVSVYPNIGSGCIGVGEPVTYTIEITNSGDVNLNRVSVTDTLYSDISSHFSAVLLPGYSDTYTFNYTIKSTDPDPLSETVVAHYSITGLTNDITDTDISSSVGFTEPSIRVIKTASPKVACPGEEITYTIEVYNDGCDDLNLYTFYDTIMGDISSHFSAVLPAQGNESWSYPYTKLDSDANPLVNTVTAVYRVTGSTTNITDSDDASVLCNPPEVGGEVAYDNFSGLLMLLFGLTAVVIGGGVMVGVRRRSSR